jgi:putative transposase
MNPAFTMNQNAYVESFNGRLRDECLNEHWFTSLAHARVVIEAWRRDYNEQRSKKDLGGLLPAVFASNLQQMQDKAQEKLVTLCSDGL